VSISGSIFWFAGVRAIPDVLGHIIHRRLQYVVSSMFIADG